ncbi:MAG: hypothetical protein ACRDFT_03975 [bacterium]
MRRVLRISPVPALAAVLLSGCWYHRVLVPSPVTAAAEETRTYWSFLWRSTRVTPALTCIEPSFKEVVVRSNWGFGLLTVATLGLVAPVRVEQHCARPVIVDEVASPDTAPSAPPGSATYWSVFWGAIQRERTPQCNERPLKEVVVRSNPAFNLLSVGTLGLVAPARIGWHCVPKNGHTGSSSEPAR